MSTGIEPWATQVGIGGIFAIVVLRLVFDFLRNKKNNRSVGNSVTRTEFTEHKSTVQTKSTCDQIVKRFDGVLTAMEKKDEERRKFEEAHFVSLGNQLDKVKEMIGGLRTKQE